MKLHQSLVASALLASTLLAQATEITLTVSGHVLDFSQPGVVVDHTGIFGPPGMSLAGEAYSAVFRFDDTRGTLTQSPSYDLLSTPGQASAVLTIKGRSFAFSGAQDAYYMRSSTGSGDEVIVGIYDDSSADQGIYLYVMTQASFLSGSNNVARPYSYVPQPGDVVGETFNIHSYTSSGAFQWARGGLNVESISVSAVPEPAQLSLMALGLVGIAAASWRRRQPG